MNLDDYQVKAVRTANDNVDTKMALAIVGLGLAGEAGEAVDLIKKHVGHGHPLDVVKLEKELGDVLWYVAVAAWYLGIPLSKVATKNIDKLWQRYPDGFSTEASMNRAPHDTEGR
jgi:NTP pyrophosphatase (non-canonical NTP hydrolase)